MRNAKQLKHVQNFWDWFQGRFNDFNDLTNTDQSFWNLAGRRLQRLNKHLRFELSEPDETDREFIVTAQGHIEAFPMADALIAHAPRLPGWEFIALKQPKGFDFTFTYEGIAFEPRTMWFGVLGRASRPHDIGLRIGLPNFASASERQSFNAVAIILETALGERAAALDIQHLDVSALPDRPDAKGWIELHKLPKYIEMLKRQKRNT
jgi:hypothetical protein